jgi:hypothetical protein
MRKLMFLGLAVAVPLAAVAVYFAFVAAPPPPPSPAAPSAAATANLPPEHPPVGGATAPQSAERAHPQFGGAGRAVRVPDAVKGKWQAVKLQVGGKAGGTQQTVTVNLGGEATVPGSTLKIRASEFLPALQVKDNEITSASNDPNNPAALVTIWDGEKQVFHGWLFSKFPDMQPFEHPSFRVILAEGVPKR